MLNPLKKIAKIVFIALVITGVWFGYQYEKRIYDAIVITQRGLADVINFVKTEFPDQTANYVQSQNAKANGGSELPATNIGQ